TGGWAALGSAREEGAPVTRRVGSTMLTSSLCRSHLAALTAVLTVLVGAVASHATCDPSTDPDKSDVANARAVVAAHCDCAGAANHSAYVSCAALQAKATLVNKSCAGAVKKCASRSTCGKPGAVTCCRTLLSGKHICRVKRVAASCLA